VDDRVDQFGGDSAGRVDLEVVGSEGVDLVLAHVCATFARTAIAACAFATVEFG
jgi:hypothetical protein